MPQSALDPRLLATLEAVVAAGTFIDAADDLGVTQPAVSQQIGELERRLGEPVVHRRPLRLTPAGEVLLAAAGRIRAALAVADQDLRALREGESGSITVATFTSAAAGPVPDALARFHRDLPAVAIRLLQVEPPEAYLGVLRGEVDIAVTYEYPQSPFELPEGVDLQEIAIDEFVAVVPTGHRLTAQPTVTLHEVVAADLIGTPMTKLPMPGPVAETSPSRSYAVRFVGEDYTTTLQLVSRGLGVALLPRLVTTHLPDGVALLPLAGQPWHRRILLAGLARDTSSPAQRTMRRHLAAAVRDHGR
ncbi:LysR family transcriptional regulator [Nocardioides sp. Iso805N]|uniref:LysR family transcriptional regulator n=1 Tax=Nocardioides sp. Iso805N TaxID=1283287 RepID=UPI00036C1D04|nr:LysR family transcriptional regulator [Nocardioides sp. Iso805N]